jgi:hypothetical protein
MACNTFWVENQRQYQIRPFQNRDKEGMYQVARQVFAKAIQGGRERGSVV